MKNVNKILTDEQIGMLMNEISSNDMVALFLMDEDEKIHYFRNRFSFWSSIHDGYSILYNVLHEESLKYQDSDVSKYFDYCDRMHDLFLKMQRCDAFIEIYYILIDNIYNLLIAS